MAQELAGAGVDSFVCPLFAPQPTHHPRPGDCFDKVIFVSEHAVSHAVAHPGELADALAEGARWYAIGPATAAALRSHFSSDLRVPELARSEGLLEEPGLQPEALQSGQRVLLIAGEDGRPLIADTLRERGGLVHSWLVYRRVPVSIDKIIETLRDTGSKLDLCVASSGAGLELLAKAWFASGGGAEVPVCVPSPRILELAKALGWHAPVLCDGASAQATLRGLVEAGLLDANLPVLDERDSES